MMTVEGWTKAVKTWSNIRDHIPKTMRLSLIQESLKANEEREEVGKWIVSTVDEGDLNAENRGAFEKFKKKFKVSCWRKCVGIWEQVLAFQKQGEEGLRNYLEKWLELVARIKNSGGTISPMFLAHFMESAGLPDTTKQAILTMVKLEQRSTVLVQLKEAFETLVRNFNKNDEVNTNFWGKNSHDQRHSRRDSYDKRLEEDERYKGRGREHNRKDSRDGRRDNSKEEEEKKRYKE